MTEWWIYTVLDNYWCHSWYYNTCAFSNNLYKHQYATTTRRKRRKTQNNQCWICIFSCKEQLHRFYIVTLSVGCPSIHPSIHPSICPFEYVLTILLYSPLLLSPIPPNPLTYLPHVRFMVTERETGGKERNISI